MTQLIIVVIDGLQPAQINEYYAPNIHRFGAEGCFFENHHPVFPSVTRVNAATMVTGTNPSLHGLFGNTFVPSDFDSSRVLNAMEPELSEIASSGNRVLLTRTIQEILLEHGKEYMAVGVGTSGNAYCHNPMGEIVGGATIHPDFSIPHDLHGQIKEMYGDWPAEGLPNSPRFRHAMNVFTNHILGECDPDVALIWSSEPDKSQHVYGVGSGRSNLALTEVDLMFAELLSYIESSENCRDADVLVLSDHGYSSIVESIGLTDSLSKEGYRFGYRKGELLLAPNGGSFHIYVGESDHATAEKVVDWLMEQMWCGVIITSDKIGPIEGTISASEIGFEGIRTPDITVSMRWNPRVNPSGFRGYVYSIGGGIDMGTHGSMSRYEMNNVLLARGSSFRSHERIITPTGNVDILPTILQIMGIPIPGDIQGRVITESLKGYDPDISARMNRFEASKNCQSGVFQQYIELSEVGETQYITEGNSWCQEG